MIPQTEKDLTHAHQSIFVGGVEGKGLMKGPAGPCKLLPGQSGISQAYIQLNRVRIERKALSKHFEGPIVISVIVKPMRFFVVFLGAEEPIFLHGRLLGDLSCRDRKVE
jgi:hypothetical protein